MAEQTGLDQGVEVVYRVMLARPEADLRAIAKIAELSEEQTSHVLDRLSDLSLVRWHVSDRSRPYLIDPGVALATVDIAHEAAATALRHRREQARLAINEVLAVREAMSSPSKDLDIERLDTLSAVRDRLDELSSACREEVWSFNPGGGQSAENLARSRPNNEETLRRGVRMRALYLDSVRNDSSSVEHVHQLTGLGAEVRFKTVLPIRMLVIDRSKAMIPIDDEDSSRGAFVISERGMVAGLAALFVSTWKSAQPLDRRDRRSELDQPTEQEWEALRLWAQGGTDGSVARALGVSARTVRRMSDSLAKRLRAKSRFEFGARALEVGWLTSEDFV